QPHGGEQRQQDEHRQQHAARRRDDLQHVEEELEQAQQELEEQDEPDEDAIEEHALGEHAPAQHTLEEDALGEDAIEEQALEANEDDARIETMPPLASRISRPLPQPTLRGTKRIDPPKPSAARPAAGGSDRRGQEPKGRATAISHRSEKIRRSEEPSRGAVDLMRQTDRPSWQV